MDYKRGDQPTQEEMVISIRGQDVLDRSKFLDGSLGLVVEGGRGDHPDITGGELDGGRTATHWKPSEEPGKRSREGIDIGGDLCHGRIAHDKSPFGKDATAG